MMRCGALHGCLVQATAWAPLPPADTELTRIAFGSCANQKKAQPFWDILWDLRPDLTILGGDNVCELLRRIVVSCGMVALALFRGVASAVRGYLVRVMGGSSKQ